MKLGHFVIIIAMKLMELARIQVGRVFGEFGGCGWVRGIGFGIGVNFSLFFGNFMEFCLGFGFNFMFVFWLSPYLLMFRFRHF